MAGQPRDLTLTHQLLFVMFMTASTSNEDGSANARYARLNGRMLRLP